MRRSIILLMVFALLSSILVPIFVGALALADSAPTIQRSYSDMSKTGITVVDNPGSLWDLTRGPLTISFTLDMSGDLAKTASSSWTQVGVYGPPGQAVGWMNAGAPKAYEQHTEAFDMNDMLVLENKKGGYQNEYGYDTISTSSIGNVPIDTFGWLGHSPRGIYFDRGDATSAQNVDPATINTNGTYKKVSITFTSLDEQNGTMFATVNGMPQYFWNYSTGQYVAAGKSFFSDMHRLQVFADIENNCKISNFVATGSPAEPVLYGLYPTSGEQGQKINNFYVNGNQFRSDPTTGQLVPSTLELNNPVTKEFVDAANLHLTAGVMPTNSQVMGDFQIPDNATPGKWDTNFWHNDDKNAAAKLPGSFDMQYATPSLTAISPDHCRPGQSITITMTGAHLRNPSQGVTVQLLGAIFDSKGNVSGTAITGTNVKWMNSKKVQADFKIPSNAYIGCNWSLFFQHMDDKKSSTLSYCFSVDARMDINAFTCLNILWLHLPSLLSVTLYSDPGFDATTVFPLAVSFAGTFPIAVNTQDVDHDGRKDQIYYFNNMAVNLPTGTNSVNMLAASWQGLRQVEAWDTVRVFKFLF